MLRKLAVSSTAALLLVAATFGTAALAAGPGASDCGRSAGQFTAGVAKNQGQGFGQLVSSLAPINGLNQQSLFNC